VDGQAPVRVDFDPTDYALSLPLTVSGEGQLPDLARRELGLDTDQPLIAGTNRDPGRLTTVVLTGVTALVRATAFTMEQRGVTYPAQDIRDILRSADILHISNEVPFARDCPFPDPVQEGLKFCSSPDYMGLLEDIGTDVVELTGDHFADWGRDAMDYTLDLYEKHDWPVYGGGRDLAAGKAPLTLEHNGNKIAFIGCNAKGGPFAQAGPSNPGAVPCDFDYMHTQIEKLRDQGYNVIATFQHFEYYTYQAQPNQVADSEGMARAGAVIVSGSQAHQPQAMEFFKDSFIHYGLGNLFFDQYDISPATRQAFIDRHVFYDGRYISTELIPIIFVDYARARPMNTDEAAELLNSVFLASGW
jgi:poly-gamma-glutamate synthesis protein (capsule biosynthesis protein)